MPTSNKSGFASKVFHFDVKYHMTGYLLATNWHRLPIKQDFEGNANVLHLLGNGVSPEGITILLFKLKGFFDGLRQFNAKFMGPFQITRVPLSYKRSNAVPFPQDVRNPPVESWFVVNAKDLSIFSCFNRVRLLKISKVIPRRRAVFSLAAKLPTNGQTLQVGLHFACSGEIIQRAAKVWGSIGAVLREQICPLRLVSMLDI